MLPLNSFKLLLMLCHIAVYYTHTEKSTMNFPKNYVNHLSSSTYMSSWLASVTLIDTGVRIPSHQPREHGQFYSSYGCGKVRTGITD